MNCGLLLLLATFAGAQNVVVQPVAPVSVRINFAPVMPVSQTQAAGMSLSPQLRLAPSLVPSVLPVAPGLQAQTVKPSVQPAVQAQSQAAAQAIQPAAATAQSAQPSAGPAQAEQASTLQGRPLRLIILGPPGSGKGTYSQKLVAETGIVHISAGQLLRDYAKTLPADSSLAATMNKGGLVPTEVLMGLLRERLSRDDVRQKGFILDGSPRRMEEAPLLEAMLKDLGLQPDAVVRLEVSEAELKRRILARGRADDSESVFAERMRIYREQTLPVYDFFQGKVPFVTPSVDGSDAEANYSQVRSALEKMVARKAAADAGAASPLFKNLSEASRRGSGAALHASVFDAAGRAPALGRTATRTSAARPAAAAVAAAAALRAAPTPASELSAKVFQTRNPRDAAWAASVFEKLQDSPSGLKVLKRAEKLFSKREPIPLEVKRLGRNLAELDFLKGVIRVSPKVRKGDLGNAAATLIHELLHVLQHDQGIPSEALEMELEAHVLTLDVMRELGVPLETDPFSKEAHRRLLKSSQDFVDWLQGQLPSKPRLVGSTFNDYDTVLEEQAEDIDERIELLEERLEAKPNDAKLKAKLQEARAIRTWIDSDMAIVGSAAGRRRYRAFTKRVMEDLERYRAAVRR